MKKFNKFLCLVSSILFIIFIGSMFKLNILPFKYSLVISIILSILVAIFMFIVTRNNKLIKITGIILNVILIFSLGLGTEVIINTDNFLVNAFTTNEYEIMKYYVITTKESNNKMFYQNVGIVYFNKVSDDIALKKVRHIKEKEYYDYKLLSKSLFEGNIDCIVINSDIYNLLTDYIEDFTSTTRIVKEYYISVPMDKMTKEKALSLENDILKNGKSFNILISGIDTGGDITTVSRSDVNIIVTINPKTHEVLLTTVPRDSFVQLHGTTGIKDKLTHAGYYGIENSRKTLEDLLDIKIDYYIRINFDSLVDIINAIGGVDINNDISFGKFRKGNIHLNGKDALTYSRTRYGLPEGDISRGRHQEKVVEGIIKKVSTDKEILLNYEDVLDSLLGSYETNISSNLVKAYVKKQLDTMPKWEITSIDVTGKFDYSETYSMPGWNLYCLFLDEKSVNSAHDSIISVMKNK